MAVGWGERGVGEGGRGGVRDGAEFEELESKGAGAKFGVVVALPKRKL